MKSREEEEEEEEGGEKEEEREEKDTGEEGMSFNCRDLKTIPKFSRQLSKEKT